MDQEICKVFKAAIDEYRRIYTEESVGSLEDEGYSLLRYQVGGEYKPHVDRAAANVRIVSGLIYLNDDFEGGDLFFPRHQLTVKPRTGMVVLFPSIHTHLHASLPIKSGVKYAIVTWFKCSRT